MPIEHHIVQGRYIVFHALGTVTGSQLVVALVAPEDLLYGLSRMWQAFADDEAIQSQIFRDFSSAEIWLCSQM